MPKLVAMLRVKNGILFIDRWLSSIEPLVDEIVVVDNGSSDGTSEVLRRHPKVVAIEHTEGFHEGRDKILAYTRARERKPDWMLWLDVDEIFEERLTRAKLDQMMSSRLVTRYFFRRFHFVRDDRHIKAGLAHIFHNSYPDRVLWKEQQGGYFHNLKIHNGLICGIHGLPWVSTYRIKHFGPLYESNIREKTERYLALDPDQTDMYLRHLNENQKVRTLRWYEHDERPVFASLFTLLYTIVFLVAFPLKKLQARSSKSSGATE